MKLLTKIKEIAIKIINWYFENSDILGTRVKYDQVFTPIDKIIGSGKMYPTDGDYVVLSMFMLKNALKSNFIQFAKWRKEKFDCDDFAFVMAGQMKLLIPDIAFGYAHSKTHAFNIAVLNTGSVVVIEPQTNQVFTEKEFKMNSNYYPFRLVII